MEQPTNGFPEMLVTDAGMVTLVNLVYEKAPDSMVVNDDGRETELKEEQCIKAEFPMVANLLLKVMPVKALAP